MQSKAQTIVDNIGDYENNPITVPHVIEWVNQFPVNDREFILDELAVIFSKTYVSKLNCINLIKHYIIHWTNQFRYTSAQSFLMDTVFLDLQAANKSQKELLTMLNEVITDTYGISLAQCGQQANHFIYLDDVLSTGNTVYKQLTDWLITSNYNPQETNYEYIKRRRLKLHVCLLCAHVWGKNSTEYRLMRAFDDDIKKYVDYQCFYWVENNLKAYNAKLNHMLPIDNQPPEVQQYLAALHVATNYEDRAYRKPTLPSTETLFSSSSSRIRLENLFLKKGIERSEERRVGKECVSTCRLRLSRYN